MMSLREAFGDNTSQTCGNREPAYCQEVSNESDCSNSAEWVSAPYNYWRPCKWENEACTYAPSDYPCCTDAGQDMYYNKYLSGTCLGCCDGLNAYLDKDGAYRCYASTSKCEEATGGTCTLQNPTCRPTPLTVTQCSDLHNFGTEECNNWYKHSSPSLYCVETAQGNCSENEECKKGYYKEGVGLPCIACNSQCGEDQCPGCPFPSSSSSAPVPFTCSTDSECVRNRCPIGTYSDSGYDTYGCVDCPANTFNDSEGCSQTPNECCKNCPEGTYSEKGAGSCKNCDYSCVRSDHDCPFPDPSPHCGDKTSKDACEKTKCQSCPTCGKDTKACEWKRQSCS